MGLIVQSLSMLDLGDLHRQPFIAKSGLAWAGTNVVTLTGTTGSGKKTTTTHIPPALENGPSSDLHRWITSGDFQAEHFATRMRAQE
jgi:hypothetical protein